MNLVKQVLSVVAMASFALPAAADFGRGPSDREREMYLGSTVIERRADYDVIDVRSCDRFDMRVTAVKVRVSGEPLEIYSLAVVYGDGDYDEIPVREYFRPGTQSQWKDLEGRGRCVREIRIFANARGGRSVVEVTGKGFRNRLDN